MRNYLLKVLVVLVAVLGTLVVTTNEANAQRRARAASRYQIDQTIRRVETNADRFVAALNDSLDNSRLEDTNAEDNLNGRARALGDATDKLRREFDRGDSLQENRRYVRDCLVIASRMDRTMRARRFGRQTEGIWVVVRNDLNALARYYGLSPIGRDYR